METPNPKSQVILNREKFGKIGPNQAAEVANCNSKNPLMPRMKRKSAIPEGLSLSNGRNPKSIGLRALSVYHPSSHECPTQLWKVFLFLTRSPTWYRHHHCRSRPPGCTARFGRAYAVRAGRWQRMAYRRRDLHDRRHHHGPLRPIIRPLGISDFGSRIANCKRRCTPVAGLPKSATPTEDRKHAKAFGGGNPKLD
jgi:hypothetical protein